MKVDSKTVRWRMARGRVEKRVEKGKNEEEGILMMI